MAVIELERCVVASIELKNDVDKAGILQLSVETFTRDNNRLGKPVNMHVVPPARFSIPVAMAGVHGHLFRIHASRMSVLFLIWEAQIQKYTATILFRMERKKIVDGMVRKRFWIG